MRKFISSLNSTRMLLFTQLWNWSIVHSFSWFRAITKWAYQGQFRIKALTLGVPSPKYDTFSKSLKSRKNCLAGGGRGWIRGVGGCFRQATSIRHCRWWTPKFSVKSLGRLHFGWRLHINCKAKINLVSFAHHLPPSQSNFFQFFQLFWTNDRLKPHL